VHKLLIAHFEHRFIRPVDSSGAYSSENPNYSMSIKNGSRNNPMLKLLSNRSVRSNGSVDRKFSNGSTYNTPYNTPDPSILRGAVGIVRDFLACYESEEALKAAKKHCGDLFPLDRIFHSKYGDVSEILGLHRINQKGWMPLSGQVSGSFGRQDSWRKQDTTNSAKIGAVGGASNKLVKSNDPLESHNRGTVEYVDVDAEEAAVKGEEGEGSGVFAADVPLPLFTYAIVSIAFARTESPGPKILPMALLGACTLDTMLILVNWDDPKLKL
jgi:hypothetical protein